MVAHITKFGDIKLDEQTDASLEVMVKIDFVLNFLNKSNFTVCMPLFFTINVV